MYFTRFMFITHSVATCEEYSYVLDIKNENGVLLHYHFNVLLGECKDSIKVPMAGFSKMNLVAVTSEEQRHSIQQQLYELTRVNPGTKQQVQVPTAWELQHLRRHNTSVDVGTYDISSFLWIEGDHVSVTQRYSSSEAHLVLKPTEYYKISLPFVSTMAKVSVFQRNRFIGCDTFDAGTKKPLNRPSLASMAPGVYQSYQKHHSRKRRLVDPVIPKPKRPKVSSELVMHWYYLRKIARKLGVQLTSDVEEVWKNVILAVTNSRKHTT